MCKSITVCGMELTGIPDDMEIVRHSPLAREGFCETDEIAFLDIVSGVQAVVRDGVLHIIEA